MFPGHVSTEIMLVFVYFTGPPHEPGGNMLEKKNIATPTILGDTRALHVYQVEGTVF